MTFRRNSVEDTDPRRAELDAEVERLSNEVAAAEALTGGRVLRLNPEQLHRGEIKMRDLAKRAEKLGLEAPRLRTVAEGLVPAPRPKDSRMSPLEWEEKGDKTTVTYVIAEGPEPKLNGWEFVATLQHLEGINVIRRVPGTEEDVDLSQHRAGEATCDYCKTVRDRKDTFIVHQVDADAANAELADEHGNVQVGRNCLRDFLGHGDPQQIAAYLERWMALDLLEVEDEDGDERGGRVKTYMPVEDYLVHVATMLRTNGWRPRSAGPPATADQARDNRFYFMRGSKDRTGQPMWVDPTPEDEERAKAAIAWAREHLGAKVNAAHMDKQTGAATDFEHNMYAVVKGDHVPEKGEGIAAYVIVAHSKFIEREIEQRERAKVDAESEYVGTVGERMDIEATVMNVHEYEGNYGTTFITKLRDDQGNVYTWFGSYELERGAVVKAKWTIKNHEEYKGTKQTVLNRPSKMETVRNAAGEEGLPEGWVPMPVADVKAGDNLLVLPTGGRGVTRRLVQPDENALDGVGTEVIERDGRLVAWTITGQEIELPAEGEVIRLSDEPVRTEGIERPAEPDRLVSKGPDPLWGTPVYETGDGRGRIVLDPTYETWCDDPHPMKFSREEREAFRAMNADERERFRRSVPYDKYQALMYGKKGYQCPGGEEHNYSQWVPELDGERMHDVYDTFGQAKKALEEKLGYKLRVQRQPSKPAPVTLTPEDEYLKEVLEDEIAGIDQSLASFEELLAGPDAQFVDQEQIARIKRRREQAMEVLAKLGRPEEPIRTEGIEPPPTPEQAPGAAHADVGSPERPGRLHRRGGHRARRARTAEPVGSAHRPSEPPDRGGTRESAAKATERSPGEISGDPTLQSSHPDQPVWGAGAAGSRLLRATSTMWLRVRPDASKLSFLHEIGARR